MRRPHLSPLEGPRPRLSARELKRLAAASRSLTRSGSRQGILDSTGLHERPSIEIENDEWFLAKIVNAGPSAEADYADARYWLRQQRISNTDGDDATNLTYENHPAADALYVTGTNLDELIATDHDLPVDGTIYVIVFPIEDKGGTTRYVFSGPAIVVD